MTDQRACTLDGPSVRFPLSLVLLMTGVLLLAMTSCSSTDTARSAPPTATASPALRTFESSVAAFVLLDSIGGSVGPQQKRVVVNEAVKPSGVFAFVILHLESVADSAVYVADTDFRIVDEEGRSYGISDLATQAYVRSSIRAIREGGAQNRRSGVPLEFSENGYKVLYADEPVPAGSELRIKAIYDIPDRDLDRRLKIRYRDEPPLDLPGAH